MDAIWRRKCSAPSFSKGNTREGRKPATYGISRSNKVREDVIWGSPSSPPPHFGGLPPPPNGVCALARVRRTALVGQGAHQRGQVEQHSLGGEDNSVRVFELKTVKRAEGSHQGGTVSQTGGRPLIVKTSGQQRLPSGKDQTHGEG